MDVAGVLVAVITLVAGLVIGLLVGRSRSESARRAGVAAAEEAGRAAVASTEAAGRAALAQAEAELRDSREELASVRATLASERAAAQERVAAEAAVEARLRETFDSLASTALQRNNEAFAELAEARLTAAKTGADGDLAQRQIAIEALVSPLRESLTKVERQLNAVERDRAGSYEKLLEQIGTMRQTNEQLRTETAQLVTALRAPQVRGRWGEMQLRRAVEAAGMTEHIDFVEQQTVDSADGKLRPDLVVRLVGGKNVVVDSKVAFSGYLEAMEAKDEPTRETRLKAHARHMRTHIDQLAAKSYWEHFAPSPEFVVCFVPSDAFLDAALREDPGLQERAFDQNVVLATPSTLVALLRTIAYTWRQEALAANAAEVHHLGRELYQRLSTMGTHIDKLGSSLTSAVTAYNKTVSSIESRVFVTARKMAELKVVDPNDELTAPRQVTESARTVQAQEIADQRLVALPRAGQPRGVPSGQGELLPEAGAGDNGQRATS